MQDKEISKDNYHNLFETAWKLFLLFLCDWKTKIKNFEKKV